MISQWSAPFGVGLSLPLHLRLFQILRLLVWPNLNHSLRPGTALMLLLLWCPQLHAEHLPITTYTTVDGLAGDDISSVIEDQQGFLWIGTQKGLSRFDGHAFKNFGKAQGLTKTNIVSLALAPDGTIWVAVWGGVYSFDPKNGGSFTEIPFEGSHRPLEGIRLIVDQRGDVWCGFDGLYRLEPSATGKRFKRFDLDPRFNIEFVTSLLSANDGIWFGYKHLYHLATTGELTQIPETQAENNEFVSLTYDSSGQVWAGAVNALWRLVGGPRGTPLLQLCSKLDFGHAIGVYVISREPGGVWAGSRAGLLEVNSGGELIRRITRQEGMVTTACAPLFRDATGDLWLGSGESGLMRLKARGFTSFGNAEGLEATRISSIFRSKGDELIVVGEPHVLQSYSGDHFTAVNPIPPTLSPGWGWNQAETQDRDLQWWIPTSSGLVELPKARTLLELSKAKPRNVFTNAGCFRGNVAFRIYEQSNGNLWISTIERDHEFLYQRDRESGTFICYDPEVFLGVRSAATAFREDQKGSLWLGFYTGQVVRFRNDGFKCVLDCKGERNGLVNDIHLDRRGRLWLATARQGVFRIENPDAEEFTITNLTTREGLSSNLTRSVVEDRYGKIYIATESGVDILDEAISSIRHMGVGDGLPNHYVSVAWADPNGDLWFGTFNGLARLSPTGQDKKSEPPRVLLNELRIEEKKIPLSAIGETKVEGIVMGPSGHDAEISFLVLPRSVSDSVLFQYRLANDGEWSIPSPLRSLLLAGLTPGDYRFEVRAVDNTGTPSAHSAILSFRILAPFYQRPWFLVLLSALFLLIVFGLYRLRLERLLALQRLRTNIAMDLHDEMGSGLGSIGLLADLATDEELSNPRRDDILNQIACTASELGTSLTDIIWSLRTEDESIESFAHHVAERGRRMFPGPRPTFVTDFPDKWSQVNMTLPIRRNLLLIALEALHNVARHSDAATVTLTLRETDSKWFLSVSDDGKGLENGQLARNGGFGFETMKKRASEVGELKIESGPNVGTTITITFDPQARHR